MSGSSAQAGLLYLFLLCSIPINQFPSFTALPTRHLSFQSRRHFSPRAVEDVGLPFVGNVVVTRVRSAHSLVNRLRMGAFATLFPAIVSTWQSSLSIWFLFPELYPLSLLQAPIRLLFHGVSGEFLEERRWLQGSHTLLIIR